MPNQTDLTNSRLSRFLSIEIIGSMIATAFMVGVTYNTLAGGQEKAEKRIGEVEQNQREIEKTVHRIDTAVEIIRNEQAHLKDDVGELKDDLREMRQDVGQMLEILRKEYDRVNGGDPQ